MPSVVLLTCDQLSRYDVDSPLLVDSLARVNCTASIISWDSPEIDVSNADLAIVRSTWDYSTRLSEFFDRLSGLAMPVLNPLEAMRWNSHKGYLLELERAGVPIVPTTVVPAGVAAVLPEMPDGHNIVIKPATSAGARGLGRFPANSGAAQEHLRHLAGRGDVLIQPYLPEIVDGERSLVFLDGVYSHAVRKVPVYGDFRVQEQHGGRNFPYVATGAEREVAALALRAAPQDAALLYARVDLAGSVDAPLLMELELIEPGLFLDLAPDAPDRLAQAISSRIAG